MLENNSVCLTGMLHEESLLLFTVGQSKERARERELPHDVAAQYPGQVFESISHR